MQSIGQRRICIEAIFYLLHQIVLTESQHELLHVHRIKRFHIDLSDREREFCPVDRNAEQASRNDNVILRRVLTKVFERSQRSFAKLHLIEYYQRLFSYDGLSRYMG